MEEFLKVLRNDYDGAYDCICREYWQMDKTELKDIIKELLYAIYYYTSEFEEKKIFKNVYEELKDYYDEEYFGYKYISD